MLFICWMALPPTSICCPQKHRTWLISGYFSLVSSLSLCAGDILPFWLMQFMIPLGLSAILHSWLATFWSEQDAAVSLFLLYLISPCCICLIPIHTLISSWPQSPGETLRGRPRAAQGGAERFRGKHLGLQRAGDSVGERWIQWISLKYFKGIYVATQNGIYGDFNINIYVTNVTSYDPI